MFLHICKINYSIIFKTAHGNVMKTEYIGIQTRPTIVYSVPSVVPSYLLRSPDKSAHVVTPWSRQGK